jgi:hypothetical protein
MDSFINQWQTAVKSKPGPNFCFPNVVSRMKTPPMMQVRVSSEYYNVHAMDALDSKDSEDNGCEERAESHTVLGGG